MATEKKDVIAAHVAANQSTQIVLNSLPLRVHRPPHEESVLE